MSKLQKKESRSVAQICEAFRWDGLNAYAKGGANLRHKGNEGELKRKEEYRQLLRLTRQILNDSRRVFPEVEALPPRCRREVSGRSERLEAMADQVCRVVRQTKARVFAGLTQSPDKLVSVFEPETEIIRKAKAGKPNEFGKLVELAGSGEPGHYPLRGV